ncbi:molybdenum cofactor guanylyltransferase MobA [Helicobacter sp. faydin-H20]|uniref:molybdenum cofactor guanylyltransferase MobA n=1 Tax=Helicobacter anatolicus TaxID=2905874 RepID=UPI001E58F546|nr:molybdenum cofactor guanylyltransferase MobA [Helicobacter anatolicus]MCE3036337.1 molybdenum cofactor guanylyltransferase MobA [Helicobacter anatolicus]
MNIPCVILCGGKSSRMGSNKALLPFGEKTLLQYQFQKMQKIFSQVYIASKQDFFNFPCIKDNPLENTLYTPLLALESAFLSLDSEKIFFICVDTPLVPPSLIISLLTQAQKNTHDIFYIKTPEKEHYLTAIWHKNTLSNIQNALKNQKYKIKNILQECKIFELNHDNDKDLSNLNTPHDYQLILREYYGR